jgi:hypothetical protein
MVAEIIPGMGENNEKVPEPIANPWKGDII